MTTLTDGTTTVNFTDDLLWSDEFSWQPVEQSETRSITGALVLQIGVRTAGQPITLEPPAEGGAWLARAQLDQLAGWAAVPGQVLTLTLRGVARSVVWRHQNTAITAQPVMHCNDVQAADDYIATLRLQTI